MILVDKTDKATVAAALLHFPADTSSKREEQDRIYCKVDLDWTRLLTFGFSFLLPIN